MIPTKGRIFAGIDWAEEKHRVVILDADAKVLSKRDVIHNAEAVNALALDLLELANGAASDICVGIEAPRGQLVNTLMEHGMSLFSINPKQVDRFRDRQTPSGAKDDDRDAYLIGRGLITDIHCYRKLRREDPVFAELRMMSRTHDVLTEDIGRLQNRARQSLHAYYPHFLQAGSLQTQWMIELWHLAPNPRQALKLTAEDVEEFLRNCRVRSKKPEDLLKTLHQKPMTLNPGDATGYETSVRYDLNGIMRMRKDLKDCDKRISELLGMINDQQSKALEENEPGRTDIEIIRSITGTGDCVISTLYAEAGSMLESRDKETLRAFSGIAPVTKRTGKMGQNRRVIVRMRRACNRHLRNAFYHWGRVAAQRDPYYKIKYKKMRARGLGHARACRQIADSLLDVLFAMLKSRTLYDPLRRVRFTA